MTRRRRGGMRKKPETTLEAFQDVRDNFVILLQELVKFSKLELLVAWFSERINRDGH